MDLHFNPALLYILVRLAEQMMYHTVHHSHLYVAKDSMPYVSFTSCRTINVFKLDQMQL